MAIAPHGAAPYAPPKAVIEIVDRYRHRGLTVPITTEILVRAGIAESLSRRTLQALRLLDFIDAEGNPSPELERLSRAPADEWRSGLRELLAAAYAEVFAFADPATDPIDRIRDAFRPFNPRGQQERMVTLFLGLLEWAEQDIRGAATSRKKPNVESRPQVKVSKSAGKSAPGPARPKKANGSSGSSETGVAEVGDLPAGLVGLLHQIPTGGSGWTRERREIFVRAFEAVLDFTVPVTADETAVDDEGGEVTLSSI